VATAQVHGFVVVWRGSGRPVGVVTHNHFKQNNCDACVCVCVDVDVCEDVEPRSGSDMMWCDGPLLP
jgi:hypothetical protein